MTVEQAREALAEMDILSYGMTIKCYETGLTDTQCRATWGEMQAALYEACRVAQLSGMAFSVRCEYTENMLATPRPVLFVSAKSELLACMRDAIRNADNTERFQ
jgi:hypothetical protein